MDYFLAACDREQEQRQQRWVDIEAERDYQEIEAAARQARRASVRFGTGQLCTCGMKCAEDCDCHPF